MPKEKQVEEVKESSTDFVQLVKDAVPSMGSSTFTRINLEQEVTVKGLQALNDEYSSQGYEVFANGKSVLLLKQ